ncbi:protein translocase subunit SecF [Rhodobacter capsulatus]|jgi:preprotein translocase subunit SecF|uniref:Protein translocase subunit SecF n=1 Tax=Rhodobacter capsulatus (strain ATCC BAA-309 / NBRC 16581 / SB1003) TaxID=272942 RepID=SECF_RHOCB|nr:protein translocase subunit SecF [Rhodobacter capsulatus]O33518.1 RecName: Full=Protein translocase subunit SecF [Rhodobacter capsulatus SB 1003]AAB62802.1 SecF [Rhodobacter capsulatus SB 1003]ADE85528.1 protein-export membrane protein SecF [Rhodobacter capsulatus SB 1003]ETD01562.1 preprotein translocase subunit SecF [Rhodobacter capsulatus DE442]ETD76629.1 preprotein translocase subunit SecF [Rhodobacter capsulatus R121]ETE53465.1 preprotein translocase subunit SecF [Rhodobacter capsulat
MAFRLKLVPEKTNFDFFRWQWATFGAAIVMMIASVILPLVIGLNFGIDFKGGTTIRTESTTAIDVGVYRAALEPLELGDVIISEVRDPSFREDQHVAMIRIQMQEDGQGAEGQGAQGQELVNKVETALTAVDPALKITSFESVGPKVSGELVWTAVWSLLAATVVIMFYIWVRFEWQFALGAVVALVHDVLLTVGLFAVLQLKFDLTTVAALLTITGYSINDTVVVFDRLRENLIKYKTMPLRDVMNLSVNETLSRTVMTGMTTLLALVPMLIWGGDVIRGFVFAMVWGVFTGTYSSVYVAKNIVLFIGLDRNKEKKDPSDKFFSNGAQDGAP